ncbi:unnamed protein product [Adineta steineri]|uniref:Uncharacterized protein n=1 Tax=Adineta steineri TaxID=433720 RepID=A0A818QB49_9BILA|nr:unnamed protein product [Adineta steineri]CAF3632093.1 unnamed protein product [Adineta steineri]
MPTSSQSQILSAVDYQLFQQQINDHNGRTKRISIHKKSVHELKRRQSTDNTRRPTNITARHRNSVPTISKRYNLLHMPVINLYSMTQNEQQISSQSSVQSSINNDNQIENFSTTINDTHLEDINRERRPSLLNENTRRLLLLGTIRPSKTFYKDLPEVDVEQLMEYFRRMRNTNIKMTSEEISQELKTQFTEYKSKTFFDSACVTKAQIKDVEEIVEPYADQIRTHQAELIKVDNPMRFIIKQIHNDQPLTVIPREYNDCFLTLITQTDPLCQSTLISELIQDQLCEDLKANSLDISYFPGGINYEIPRDEIDKNGQMAIKTYEKLKKRLNKRKVWYFSRPPEKKPYALLAILPANLSNDIHHQQLLDCLYDRLKTFSMNESSDIKKYILSIEFIPLNLILDSNDISNQFIIDCDSIETKQQLMEKPLKFNLDNHSITIDLHSYDEDIQREYDKFIKAEKYRELIKNHDDAVKRIPIKK